MPNATIIDALKVLEVLDSQLDSSLQAELEERLLLVVHEMQKATGASGAWLSWVLPRHERKTGQVGKCVTSDCMPEAFKPVIEMTRTLGQLSKPTSEVLPHGSWAAAPLAINRQQPFGVFGLAYENKTEIPGNAQEIAQWIAARLDSEIHALSLGSTLHQFNTELDQGCDQGQRQDQHPWLGSTESLVVLVFRWCLICFNISLFCIRFFQNR